MPTADSSWHLPDYHNFINSIAVLDLPMSASELHGVICGYLCAGATSAGEAYLRALMPKTNDSTARAAALALFEVYSVSQQQIANFDFSFQLLLPDDDEPLAERAKAFGECCEGFIQGMTLAGLNCDQLHEEESQEAWQHLSEFAKLDYHSLHIDEEDERALMEVSEYARMAMLRIYSELQINSSANASSETAH